MQERQHVQLLNLPPCCPSSAAGQVGDCDRGVGASWHAPVYSGRQARNKVARQKISQHSHPEVEALREHPKNPPNPPILPVPRRQQPASQRKTPLCTLAGLLAVG